MTKNQPKVVSVEHFSEAPDECSLCRDSLDDPFKLNFDDGESVWICDNCGKTLESWGLIPSPKKKQKFKE